MAKDFFPKGKIQCPQPGMVGCAMSIGVYGYECCGSGNADCCGYISGFGYTAMAAIPLLIILVIKKSDDTKNKKGDKDVASGEKYGKLTENYYYKGDDG
ncbi:hypothetical protein Aduo_002739 [Ancylostoma duodenale]